MKLISSYGVTFKGGYSAVKATIAKYNEAVRYLLLPVQDNWDSIKPIGLANDKVKYVERLVHSTRNRTAKYDFDYQFYKFPSYLRRSAIMDAIGTWSAYMSSVDNWVKNNCKGARPKPDKCEHLMPCFYRDNMFIQTGKYTAEIKVYRNHDWVWQSIRLNKSDVDYLTRRSRTARKVSAPVVQKKHGHYELYFTLEEYPQLSDKPIYDQKVCAVDLGIGTDATCSVLNSHGTVLSRKFINCGKEKDSVKNALHRVSVFQRLHGPHNTGRLWNIAKRRNLNLAHLIAHKIVIYAFSEGCDVIVFEHLDTNGKKKGSKRQKLAMWCHADVQNTAERLAHQYGMHVSHVCAWDTSKLAFDGSGIVKRGRQVSDSTPYDMCEFKNGKTYNCDLSASYNIGARYIIRALCKDLPHLQAEVPAVGSGTQRTLSTLWMIDNYLYRA